MANRAIRSTRVCLLFALCSLLLWPGIIGCSNAGSEHVSPTPPARTLDRSGFDGSRAYDLLKQQVELGPRCPGLPGHRLGAEWITSRLKQYADSAAVQSFEQDIRGKKFNLQNIIGRFDGKSADYVLLAAHWDTRPTADYEVVAEKRNQPIPGANDGASGVAALLELARIFNEKPPQVGVIMVFFDGEDYGPTAADMFLGSRYFAKNLSGLKVAGGKPLTIRYGILLDMIGDKDLVIPQEEHSLRAAPDVVEKVWSTAAKLGYSDVFVKENQGAISDDHVPLIEAGVKCIDLIDFNYGPWHTLADTPDKCSAESLKVVGDVVASVVYGEPAK